MNFKICAALIINVIVVLLTINAFLMFRHNQETIHPGKSRFHFYIYFTSDSNILNALCSVILIPYLVMNLTGAVQSVPMWAYAIHFIGACAVMVTCMTVILFLGPIAGYRLMYTGSDLYLHLICPLLALVSCCFLAPLPTAAAVLPFYLTFLGIIPTVVYGAVYMVMVLLLGPKKGGWEDFYTFNRGGKWYISALLMVAGSYLISLGMYFLCRI